MKIGILKTGRPPQHLADKFGDYPTMFARMLGSAFDVQSFDAEAGELPTAADGLGAYLITGSPAGVYDDLPWIEPLKDFIRAANNSKLVGVCFGHQVMAEALGGRVEKSDKGWGAGLHRYAIQGSERWIDKGGTIAIPASHQDQVVVQPPNSSVVARSDFTPFAALAWTDRPAISFQFHPEFRPEFAKSLIAERYDIVPDADTAMASLDAPNDNERVAGWIRRFLRA